MCTFQCTSSLAWQRYLDSQPWVGNDAQMVWWSCWPLWNWLGSRGEWLKVRSVVWCVYWFICGGKNLPRSIVWGVTGMAGHYQDVHKWNNGCNSQSLQDMFAGTRWDTISTGDILSGRVSPRTSWKTDIDWSFWWDWSNKAMSISTVPIPRWYSWPGLSCFHQHQLFRLDKQKASSFLREKTFPQSSELCNLSGLSKRA